MQKRRMYNPFEQDALEAHSSVTSRRNLLGLRGAMMSGKREERTPAVLEWDFKDGWDGTKLVDLSGNGNDGVFYVNSGTIDYDVGSDYVLPYGATSIRQSKKFDYSAIENNLTEIVVMDYEYLAANSNLKMFGLTVDYACLEFGQIVRNAYYNTNITSEGNAGGSFTICTGGVKNAGKVVLVVRYSENGSKASGWQNKNRTDVDLGTPFNCGYALWGNANYKLSRFAFNKVGAKDAAHMKLSHAEVYASAISDAEILSRITHLMGKYGIA